MGSPRVAHEAFTSAPPSRHEPSAFLAVRRRSVAGRASRTSGFATASPGARAGRFVRASIRPHVELGAIHALRDRLHAVALAVRAPQASPTVVEAQHPNRISTFTIHGNRARTFFAAACHMCFDARFGVQDLALLGEPPVEAPPRPHLRRGFLWLGSLKESWKFLRPLQAACFRRRADMHVRPNPVSGSLRSTASGSPIRRSHQDGATGC
jgi:hypothetical protein